MDINIPFTSYENNGWTEISSVPPDPREPFIDHIVMHDSIICNIKEMPPTTSNMNCRDREETFVSIPSTPQTQTTLKSVVRSCPPAITASHNPKARNRTKRSKKPKTKVFPKYKLNPEDCKTEEKKSVRHAIKCRKGRLQKAEEKQQLVQNNAELSSQVRLLTEQLRAAKEKTEALEREKKRREDVIQALSWGVTIKICDAQQAQQSQPQFSE